MSLLMTEGVCVDMECVYFCFEYLELSVDPWMITGPVLMMAWCWWTGSSRTPGK